MSQQARNDDEYSPHLFQSVHHCQMICLVYLIVLVASHLVGQTSLVVAPS